MDEPSQPAHRARRVGLRIIAGPANHRNWEFSCEAPPITPYVKIWQGVASEQPDELVFWINAPEAPYRIDRITGPFALLEIADPDARVSRHPGGGREPAFERRHILGAFLQGIARGDQPPHLVEPESLRRREADPPVRPVRRVERAAEEADARHARQLA